MSNMACRIPNETPTSSVGAPLPQIRVSGIIEESIVDGPGFRFVIFVQGCPHHCPGCHNPQTHDFAGGEMMSTEDILHRIEENPLLAGVTFSGGEPFCQPEALLPLALAIREKGLNIFCYTGYLLEDLLGMAETRPAILELLYAIDTLVDGPYKEEERDLTLKFRGSANQRMLNMQELLPKKE